MNRRQQREDNYIERHAILRNRCLELEQPLRAEMRKRAARAGLPPSEPSYHWQNACIGLVSERHHIWPDINYLWARRIWCCETKIRIIQEQLARWKDKNDPWLIRQRARQTP